MVRYKRYKKKRYSNSTRVIKMKFQSFMDISTSASSMQIITISAGGKELLQRLAPQFGAYKYYKIGNIAVKLVPASTLPVDPTGLSYEVGENPTVDPRDQLTPGMMRITNGEDVFENIAGLSDAQQHGIYNNMLLDPRWFKWMLQSGVKRHATPRYWQIGQLHQDKWPGAFTNVPVGTAGGITGTDTLSEFGLTSDNTTVYGNALYEGSSSHGFFQTGHRGVLGWLPTDGMHPGWAGSDVPLLASPPEIEVFKLVIPKMYRTNYYYRMFITETVYFKDPIVNFGIPQGVGSITGNPIYYQPLDVFHVPGVAAPQSPSTIYESDWPTDSQTGGNYGDN